jgi:CBS domain-containing protein
VCAAGAAAAARRAVRTKEARGMDTILSTILKEKAELLADGYSVAYHWLPPHAHVSRAVQLMHDAGVGCVLVIADQRLAGLFGERDLLRAYLRLGPALGATALAQVMTPQPYTVTPAMTVEQALVQCTDRRIRHLPVVEDGRLLGLVSIGDLVRFVVKDKERTIAHLIDYIHGP